MHCGQREWARWVKHGAVWYEGIGREQKAGSALSCAGAVKVFVLVVLLLGVALSVLLLDLRVLLQRFVDWGSDDDSQARPLCVTCLQTNPVPAPVYTP